MHFPLFNFLSRFALLLPMLFCASLPVQVAAEWHEQQFDVMGTRASVVLWHSDTERAAMLIAAVEAEMRLIESLMSPYIESSELSMINRESMHRAVAVSEGMYDLLQRAIYFGELSDGAFDISFASVGHLYDYRKSSKPGRQAIAQALPGVDYRSIRLREHGDGGKTVRLLREGMKIDLGGIAKGHAVDRCIEILAEAGVQSALVSAGGDSRMLGDRGVHPETGERLSWVIGVRHPRGEEDVAAFRLPLSSTAISTSGDYERYFDEGDQRYHHIIVPSTGESASGVVSVSVIGPKSTDCDALSTAVFVLGVERGLELINGIADYDAIVIDSAGKVHYSNGLSPNN